MATVLPVPSSRSTAAVIIAASELPPTVPCNRRISSLTILSPCRPRTPRRLPNRASASRTPAFGSQDQTPHGYISSRGVEVLDSIRELAIDNGASSLGYSLGVAVRCCAALGTVRAGKELHALLVRGGFTDVERQHAESSLVGFYSKCGMLGHARAMFDGMSNRDVVAWTAMLAAYADADCREPEMWDFFDEFLASGVLLNHYTFTTLLRRAGLEEGQQVHSQVVKRGRWDRDAYVGSALVDVYARNGELGSAEKVFDRIAHKDAICFNGLITGYGRTGDARRVFSTFEAMCMAGLHPTQSTYVGTLNGCANYGSLRLSKQLHGHVTTTGYARDQRVGTVLIDAYAKCGDLASARTVFDGMGGDKMRTVFVWNTMIAGYGKHGQGEESLRLFHTMQLASVPPDHITFTCLLSACSHSGMYSEGWEVFNSMVETYGIPPRSEHYSCMVDLMGRAGMVDEAYEFIRGAVDDDSERVGGSVWGSLLSACREWGRVDIGVIAARKLFDLEPRSSSSYVALAGLLKSRGHPGDATGVRELMNSRKVKKDAGCSWVEVDGVVHRFRAGQGCEC